MILHVILRRMSENDPRVDFPDDGGQPSKGLDVVENLQIAARSTMKFGPRIPAAVRASFPRISAVCCGVKTVLPQSPLDKVM